MEIITSNGLRSPPWLGWPLRNNCVTDNHGYVPFVVSTSWYFAHSWVIIGFVTRITRRVPLVEQELLTLPEHLSSPPVFSGISCYSIFSFMSMFCRSLFVLLYSFFWPLCCLFFDIRILITPLVSSNSSFNWSFYTLFLFVYCGFWNSQHLTSSHLNTKRKR